MHLDSALAIAAIAWKNVARKIFRNFVLALAVSLLVALLVFAMLFTKAVREDIDAAAMRLGADIVTVPQERNAWRMNSFSIPWQKVVQVETVFMSHVLCRNCRRTITSSCTPWMRFCT